MLQVIRHKFRNSTSSAAYCPVTRKQRTRLHFLVCICLPCTLILGGLLTFKLVNHTSFNPFITQQDGSLSDPEERSVIFNSGSSVSSTRKFILESQSQKRNTAFQTVPLISAGKSLLNFKNSLSEKAGDRNGLKCPVTIVLILCNDNKQKNPGETSNNNGAGNGTTLENPTGKVKKSVPATPGPGVKVARSFDRQLNQTIVLLKSIAIQQKFSESESKSESEFYKKQCVNVLILSDEVENFERVRKSIHEEQRWSPDFIKLVNLTFVPVSYPPGSEWMKKLFRPCATLRLFLADLLSEIDSVIYLDTDIILLRSLTSLWREFGGFRMRDGKTLAAMAPCLNHYDSRENLVPYFGRTGLNAGIMLMNLTRMRSSDWTKKIQMVTSAFQHQIKLADQDILNIYFHSNPEEMHELTCDWNFRPFQCRPGSFCQDLELLDGISALHGNALSFTAQGPEPLFHTVFSVFQNINMTNSSPAILLNLFINLQRRVQRQSPSVQQSPGPGNSKNKRPKKPSDCGRFGAFTLLLLKRLSRTLGRVTADIEIKHSLDHEISSVKNQNGPFSSNFS